MRAFFGEEDNGPFVMVNLLKFRETADYPDGSDADLDGAKAYSRYAGPVSDVVRKYGGKPLYDGAVTGLLLGEIEENWDMIVLVEYPSLTAFSEMLRSPEYQKLAVHRTAGLAGQLNIRTKPVSR